MPVKPLRDVIQNKLSDIGFERVEFSDKPNPNETVKERLVEGIGCDVSFINNDEFEVVMSPQNYYRLLATDFYFSYQKIINHRDQLADNKIKSFALPWILVTTYYSSFFSSIELSRLFGLYNMYLNDEHCRKISSGVNSDFTIAKGVYIGGVRMDSQGYIKIVFSKKRGSRPHEFAWHNVLEIFRKISTNSNQKNYITISEVKKILGTKNEIGSPNNIRNDWNYSYVNSYDPSFCSDVDDIRDYFFRQQYRKIFSIMKSLQSHTTKKQKILSVIFFERILFGVMESLKDKIYEEV